MVPELCDSGLRIRRNAGVCMENGSTNVLLDGSLLNNDEQLPQLVGEYKKRLAETAGLPVILDLKKLPTLYSKGISIVLGIFKDCKAHQRSFSISTDSTDVFNLLKMLKLDKVITITKVAE